MRCGDATAAIEVLTISNTNHPLTQVLAVLAQQQGRSSNIFEVITSIATTQLISSPPETDDIYEAACCVLLCGTDPLSSSPVIKTIEDYMMAQLWHALRNTNPETALAQVGTRLQELGPKHFSEDSFDGWSYAMPLLLAQQYRAALMHLAQADQDSGVLQAAHLGLFLPPLQDLGKDPQPCLLGMLLVEFSNKCQSGSNAAAAIEYLANIPDEGEMQKRIVNLIVETRKFDELVGVLSTDGVRLGSNAALDRHFSAAKISSFLVDAALAAYEKHLLKDALTLLNLAERYDILFEMLNEKLAALLTADPSGEKSFWIQSSADFDNHHLKGRRTRVMDVIEQKNKVRLVETFHILMKLFAFFEKSRQHDFKEAGSIVDQLYILPAGKDEIETKAHGYNSMETPLRNAIPSVLLGAMECLYQQYVHLKYSGVMTPANTAMHRLQELRSRAGVLTAYASAIQLSGDIATRMTNMEAKMM